MRRRGLLGALAALALAAPAAEAAPGVPWKRCGSLTVAPARLAIASYATQRLDCAHGLELVLRARRLSGGREGTLRIDGFRCRVNRVEAGSWYWCGDDRRAVRARLVVF